MKTINRRNLSVLIWVLFFVGGMVAAPTKKSVFLSSPLYTIDIGFELAGKCDPYNGASFSNLDLYSGFSSLRFVPSPTPVHPCWLEDKAGAAGMNVASFQIQGRGEIRSFAICPAWEDEKSAIPAKVMRGPKPFKPILQVLTAAEAEERLKNPTDPMTPLPMVPVVWLEYRTSFSIHGDELAWEHPKLSLGQIEDFSVVFYIPLAEIGQGRYVSLKVPHAAESENGFWSITLTPAAEK
jgi:hypothetical protein